MTTVRREYDPARAATAAKFRVKIKSLADEARHIRSQERKLLAAPDRVCGGYEPWMGLRRHRIWDVRNEARAAQLAYAFWRGRPRSRAERLGSKPIPEKRIREILQSLADQRHTPAAIAAWGDT